MFSALDKAPRIAVAEGKTHGYGAPVRSLTADSAIQAQIKFGLMQQNFSEFYELAQQGGVLNALLGLTSRKSFMGPALQRLTQEGQWRNRMVEFMSGEHTSYTSQAYHLPWTTIFIDHFTRTPIPENIEAIRDAELSLEPMAALAAVDKGFYNQMREGARIMTIDGDKLRMGSLEMQVLADGNASTARMMHDAGEIIEVDGQTYYNGLPHDRKNYPTLLLPVGSPLTLKITNNSDHAYAVVPTINGIPFKLESIAFRYNDLEASSFPLLGVMPQTAYIKPGETVTFDKFFANRTGFTTSREHTSAYLTDLGDADLSHLSFLYAPILEKSLTPEDRELIAKLGSQHLIDATMYETRYAHIREFMTKLGKAKETDIKLLAPVMSDRIKSSQLGNPFLGSLGLAAFELKLPPVKAEHRFDFGGGRHALMMGGEVTRGGPGHAGLATIAGGFDQLAERSDFMGTLQWDKYTHTFAGYAPLNLLSLER